MQKEGSGNFIGCRRKKGLGILAPTRILVVFVWQKSVDTPRVIHTHLKNCVNGLHHIVAQELRGQLRYLTFMKKCPVALGWSWGKALNQLVSGHHTSFKSRRTLLVHFSLPCMA